MSKNLSAYFVIFLGLIIAGYFFIDPSTLLRVNPELVEWIDQIAKKKTENNIDIYKPAQTEVSQEIADFTVGGAPSAKEPEISENPKMPEKKIADVFFEAPYVNEAPHGIFAGPWKNACEEASIAMVEGYYAGKKTVPANEAEKFMEMLFEKQNILYGSNSNSDAARTAEMINKYSSYGAFIKENPTLSEIKSEINQGRPVLTPNYGFGLKNPNIPFLASGSSYHMVVVIGYNDETREFITNDSGDEKTGAGYRYGYDLFMATIRDYDYSTNKVSGPSRAIFTFRK